MTIARRALRDIVGPRSKLDGVFRVDPGSIMIILKNGAPVKVVGTGHTYKRGWRAPLLGELWVVPISTAAHVVDVDVEDVGTMLDRESNTQFSIPKVSVTFEIQLKKSDDWAGLKSYVNEQGDNFAERLLPRVQNELDEAVRQTLSNYTHEELYRTNVTRYLPSRGLILDDLFEIIGVVSAHPEWNPNFTSVVTGNEEMVADVARAGRERVVGQAEFDTEYALAMARAVASGRSLDSMLNPDLSAADRLAMLEIVNKLIENPHSAAIPQMREIVDRATSTFESPTGIPTVGVGSGGLPAIEAAFPTPELSIDRTIAPAFEALGLLPLVLGAAWARRQEASVVVCVSSDPDAIGALHDELVRLVSEITNSQASIFVTRHAPDLPTVVGGYLALRVPQLAASQPRLEARLVNARLEIVLDPNDVESNDYRRMIRDPKELILEPLKRMLPYDSIDVVPV